MRYRLFAAFSLMLLFVVISQLGTAQAALTLTYTVEVHTDGSAKWTIEMKGTEIPTSFDSFNTFVENASHLVNIAKQVTNRNMTASAFSMAVNVSGSYRIVTYQFSWGSFANAQDKRIVVGDVFMVEGFFSYLYGDGEVLIKYPSSHFLESISPLPSEQIDETRTVEWYGINDFKLGEPQVVLSEETRSSPFDVLGENTILIIGLLAFAGVGSIGFYYLRFRKRTTKKESEPQTLALTGSFEAENEEKVVNLLRAAGGSMYQSAIADQCDFSRSKTSKLLAAMESKGQVNRQDKGREKVVTLIEEKKESTKRS